MRILNFIKKNWIFSSILVVLIIFISGTIYINQNRKTEIILAQGNEENLQVTPSPTAPILEEEIENITVYICGSVKTPGNVTVAKDSRLGEVLSLVGGVLPTADLEAVNLAHKLVDEEMIYIPKKGDTSRPKLATVNTGVTSASQTPGKININTAGESELDSLPGIGPSTAKKIIDYRKAKGAFTAIEDIMNVAGIGEQKFSDLKDLITVK